MTEQTLPVLTAVVAVAENDIIGRNGDLPWRMSDDLKWFKSITKGKPILMGRTTYDSIGRPLPSRLNIVLTRRDITPHQGMCVCADLNEAVNIALATASQAQLEEACVIGGAAIYEALLPRCDRLYLTRVHGTPQGDRKLPLSPEGWTITPLERITADEKNDYDATIERWDRSRN